jgi:hypothetical protein
MRHLKNFMALMATVLLFAFSGRAFAEDISNMFVRSDTYDKSLRDFIGLLLDNFIEQGIMNVARDEFTAPDATCKLIRFAIYDSVLHERTSKVENCLDTDCDKDMLTVDAKRVSYVIKDDLGIDFTEHVSCPAGNPPILYDGEKYRFKNTFKKPVYFARIATAEKLPSGEIFATGYVLEINDPTESNGTFEAFVRPNDLYDSYSLALISFETKLKK